MTRSALIPSSKQLLLLLVGFAFPFAAGAEARVSGTYGKLPLHFEANQGQTRAEVKFLCRGRGYSLYLTAGEAVLVLRRADSEANHHARTAHRRHDPQAVQARSEFRKDPEAVVLRIALVGATPGPPALGLEELPGKANYFTGRDPSKWRANIPTYGKVRYRNVYPGIDLVYYGNQGQLEHDFIVASGTDPSKILMRLEGVETLEVDAQGDLVLHLAGGIARTATPT